MSEIEEIAAYLTSVKHGGKTCDQAIYDEFVDEDNYESKQSPIDEHESWTDSWEQSTIDAANCVLKLIRAKRGDRA